MRPVLDDVRELGELVCEQRPLNFSLQLVAGGDALPESCQAEFALDDQYTCCVSATSELIASSSSSASPNISRLETAEERHLFLPMQAVGRLLVGVQDARRVSPTPRKSCSSCRETPRRFRRVPGRMRLAGPGHRLAQHPSGAEWRARPRRPWFSCGWFANVFLEVLVQNRDWRNLDVDASRYEVCVGNGPEFRGNSLHTQTFITEVFARQGVYLRQHFVVGHVVERLPRGNTTLRHLVNFL